MRHLFTVLLSLLLLNNLQAQKDDLKSLLEKTIIVAVENPTADPTATYKQYAKAVADSIILSSLKKETEVNILAKAVKNYWWLSSDFIFVNSQEINTLMKADPEQYTTLHLGKMLLTKTTTYNDGRIDTKSRDIEKLNFSTYTRNIQNINISSYNYTGMITTLNRLQYAIDYELKGKGKPGPVQNVKDNHGLVTKKVLLLEKGFVSLPLEKIKKAYTIGEVQLVDANTIRQAIMQKDARYLHLIQLNVGTNGGGAHMVIDAETGTNCLQAFTIEPYNLTEKDLRNLVKQYNIYSKKAKKS